MDKYDVMSTSEDLAATPTEQTQAEARAWVRRLTSGNATELDAQGFQRWLADGATHREAFTQAQHWWAGLDPAMAQLLSQNPVLAERLRAAGRRRGIGRRAFLGGALGAAAAAATAAVVYPPFDLWPSAREWQADFRTATGEQRRVVLAGHVQVAMNTQTSIVRQTVDGQTVGMELIAGEAAIDMPSTALAFQVAAGTGTSMAQAGKFEVRHTDASTRVTCLDGQVRVEHPAGACTLAPGQQVVYDAGAIGRVVPIDPSALPAWRDGVVVFRDTPLEQVVDEINRYRPGRVVLLAKNLAHRRVSGRFPIAALDTVLLQIQRSYSLNARSLPAGVLLLG